MFDKMPLSFIIIEKIYLLSMFFKSKIRGMNVDLTYNLIEQIAEQKINLLRRYLNQVETHIEQLSESQFYTDTQFQMVLRHSIIIAAYTTTEQLLIKVEAHLSNGSKGYRNYKKMNVITAIIKYMKEELGVAIPDKFIELDYMNDLNKIRNNIAHNGGRIYDDKFPDRLLRILKNLPYISYSDSKEILIEKEFPEVMLTNITQFFNKLLNYIDKSPLNPSI